MVAQIARVREIALEMDGQVDENKGTINTSVSTLQTSTLFRAFSSRLYYWRENRIGRLAGEQNNVRAIHAFAKQAKIDG